MNARTLLEVPFAHAVRYLRDGRRQAIKSICVEMVPVEIACVPGEQSPVAGTLAQINSSYANRDEPRLVAPVTYRLARGSDGVLRLMAPIDSWATAPCSALPAWPADWDHAYEFRKGVPFRSRLDSMRGVLDPDLEWFGSRGDRSGEHLVDGMPADGRILTHSREGALQRLQQAIRRCAVIEGVLYGAVDAPILSPKLRGPGTEVREGVLQGVAPEWYLDHVRTDALMTVIGPLRGDGTLYLHPPGTRSLSRFQVNEPAAFVVDGPWREFLNIARTATRPDTISERVTQRLMPQEVLDLQNTQEALHAARVPDRRSMSLVTSVMRTIGVLHSVAPGTFRPFQIGLENARDQMARSIEPGQLEARLEQARLLPPDLFRITS